MGWVDRTTVLLLSTPRSFQRRLRCIRTDTFLVPLRRKICSSDSWNSFWLRTQRITRSNTLFTWDALFRLVETSATWGHAGIYVQDLLVRFPLSAYPQSCSLQPWLHVRVIWGTLKQSWWPGRTPEQSYQNLCRWDPGRSMFFKVPLVIPTCSQVLC